MKKVNFSVFRFLAGVGLGGIMPNVIALLTDYSPRKMRSMVVSIVLCGYSVGRMLAPVLGILIIPSLGWGINFLGCRYSAPIFTLDV